MFGWRYGSHESGICGDNVLDFVDGVQPRAVLLEEVATLFGGGAIHDGKDVGELLIEHIMSLKDKNTGGALFTALRCFSLSPRDFIAMNRRR